MKTANTRTCLIKFFEELMSIGQTNQKNDGRIVGGLSILDIDERKSIIHMHTE